MFIKVICRQFGNHFTESTLIGQKSDKTYDITTVKHNGKPVAKKYTINEPDKVVHIWKNLIKKTAHKTEVPKLDKFI